MSDRFLSFFNSRQNQISRPFPNLQIGLAASFRAPSAFSEAMNTDAMV